MGSVAKNLKHEHEECMCGMKKVVHFLPVLRKKRT
jgi:hypothetical protein